MSSRAAAAAQTRERILHAAMELFREDHYDDVTFARVADRAGVSPQTVTLHFRTKDGLVEAVTQWWAPREEELREVPNGDALEAARKVCGRYDELGPATLRILAIEGRVAAIQPLLDRGRASHRAWVERTFGARLGAGRARLRRIMQLVAIYDIYTWHVLRRVLSPEDTILAMADLARGVLERKGDMR
ncbi:MAG TPA: helix-turn-helix domain-containing protein [Kofleriaceae bacterium]|nr:helix-turn-helix domain-containing protein [Kofleriaceae bacterium]